MKKFFLLLAAASVFLFVTACGGDSKKDDKNTDEQTSTDTDEVSDEDGEPEETDGDTEPEEDNQCENLTEGLNENLIVGKSKLERSFILRLPKEIDSDKKFPVIFFYHGYGDTAENVEEALNLNSYVDNETMPFILVIPEARSDKFGFDGTSLPTGLDWDMMDLEDESAEADMFDAVLACLGKKWKIDEKHIHVSGFSAGAITANSIGLQRPEKVASVLSYSGAYFSDKDSRDALGTIMGAIKVGDFFKWPDFAEKHTKYPQVFVFGDKEKDSWGASGMFTIYFNTMGRLGANYLTENGHDAILCEHDLNHTVAGISPESMINFFAEHPFGTEVSPYREKMPEDFSKICHFFTEEDLEGIDTGDSGDSDTGDSDTGDSDAEPLTCENFKEGLNKNLIVGEGEKKLGRDFILHLPQNIDSETQFPVIFFYHPYTDGNVDTILAQTDSTLSPLVNNTDMPFILVLPKARTDKFSLGLPPTGLDWDIINLNDGNAEADMFDAILECLRSKDMVDEERIHLSGFSAGAITANSIALMRSEQIASVLTYSGAYFSNEDNLDALGSIDVGNGTMVPIKTLINWPAFEENHNRYTQMFVFGEAGSDTWSVSDSMLEFTIDFNEMAQNDGRYFQEQGHGAILCNHGGGHNPQTSQDDIKALIKFFYDHPLGTDPSPYKEDMPEEFVSRHCIFNK